jgi:hypothetical protein
MPATMPPPMAAPWGAAAPPPQPRRPVEPPDGLEFHQLLRGGRPGWWWVGIPGVILLLIAWILAQLALIVPFLVGLMASGRSLDSSIDYIGDLEHPNPLTLAYLNVGLASAIPLAFLAIWALHGLRPGWLTSVVPRMRWGYFAICLGLAFAALIATVVVGLLLPQQGNEQISGEVASFDDRALQFILVVIFLTLAGADRAAGALARQDARRGHPCSVVRPGPRLRAVTAGVLRPARVRPRGRRARDRDRRP